jgi:Polyketide cyclase / dehydrase and lipid transport
MQKSTTVLSVPLTDLEAQLDDVESWPLFLPDLIAVRATGRDRYVFTVRQDGLQFEPAVSVRRSPRGHGLIWTTVQGPAWNGHLYLEAVDGRRTRVHLELVIDPRTYLGGLVELVGGGDGRARQSLFNLQDLARRREAERIAGAA